MQEYAIQLLRELIAIDSVNPSLVPGGAGEEEIAGMVAAEMRQMGLEVYIEEAEPGRPNVVGVLKGASPGRTLMLCGHLDTVGVAGMKSPFDPVERQGRIYGRGSQDMKGGIAAMMAVAREIVGIGGLAAGSVMLAAVADEEYASIGAEKLVERWRANGAVVLEPTDLQIATAHKGFSWVEVITKGRAAHGSRPAEGRDAILRMGRVLQQLELLNRKLQTTAQHPLLGNASLHASLIQGGRELSTYPDECNLRLERRTLTGEPENTAMSEVEKILSDLKAEDPEFRAEAKYLFGQPAYETPVDHDLPAILEQAAAQAGRFPKRGAMTFWTDAAILGRAGIPSVVFGPGGAGLHSIEEYVRIDDVLACQAILVRAARAFCVQEAQ